MKASVVVVLLLFVSGSWAQWSWTGNTTGSVSYNPPDFSSGFCVVDNLSSPTPYVVINASFPASSVYEIIVIADDNVFDEIAVFIYPGRFNASDPCTNLISQGVVQGFSGGPDLDDWYYFTAGTVYSIVVTGYNGNSGLWALSIFPSIATGAITQSSPLWTLAYTDDFQECLTGSSVPYSYFSWTQSTTGIFDVIVLFANQSSLPNWDTYAVLYEGNINNWAALAVNPCNTSAFGAQIWNYGYYSGTGSGVTIYYANLTAGVSYTVVFSGGASDNFGYYGVQVIPTRIVPFTNSPLWDQPDITSSPYECSLSGTNSSWGASPIFVQPGVYLIDVGIPTFQYTNNGVNLFVYQGNNTASPPSTCSQSYPILAFTGGVTDTYLFITSPQIISFVGGNWNGGSLPDGYAYTLYVLTGTNVGVIPPAVTTSTSTSTSTTTSTATTTTASTTTTQATTSTSTGTPVSTTSDANALFVSVLLALAALLIAIL